MAKDNRIRVWTGNDACAEAAIAAGVRFFAGYPITPASEIAEVLARRMPEEGRVFIQMEDEIASLSAVIGASFSGMKAMTATSGPGFSLMQENLGFAVEAEIPCVIVDVQRVGPSSGIATHPSQGDIMQARWGTHGDHPIIVLAPYSVRETYDLTIRAVNLAEKYRTPVILLSDAVIGHMSENIKVPGPEEFEIVNRPKPTVPPDRYRPYEAKGGEVPPMASFGDGYIWYTTGIIHDETGFPCTGNPALIDFQVRRLHQKIYVNRKDIVTVDVREMEDAEVAVIAMGSVARSAVKAVKLARAKGIRAGLFRLVTMWPFPEEELLSYMPRLKSIVVAELNLGQLQGQVRQTVEGRARVVGVNRIDSRLITPEQILAAILQEVGA
ncbi:MAG: 2-oxoacid:acceptor oxidoreductase subunit alpha [Bacillota bacterium]